MRGLMLSVRILAAIGALSGVAGAQVGLSTKPNWDAIDNAIRIEEYTRAALLALRKVGVEALQTKNYLVAEKTFGDLLHRNPTTTDANFLMGLAKLGLENWVEAKQFLELAVKQEPGRPEPKARLGLTYVKLNDIDGAMKQRAELASMDGHCKSACGDAARIADGLTLLDQALGAERSKVDLTH
jgi:tetratricopeptide (TPR) repeat protein